MNIPAPSVKTLQREISGSAFGVGPEIQVLLL